MNIKAIATAALAAASLAVAAPLSAEAASCFDAPGGVICNTFQGSQGGRSLYTLGYSGQGYNEGMSVVCNGSYVVDWSSRGNMPQSLAQSLAEYFCAY